MSPQSWTKNTWTKCHRLWDKILHWVGLSHCDKPSKFTRSECHNLGWTDNPSPLRRNVTVVNCHSIRFVGWMRRLGWNVVWSVRGWTAQLYFLIKRGFNFVLFFVFSRLFFCAVSSCMLGPCSAVRLLSLETTSPTAGGRCPCSLLTARIFLCIARRTRDNFMFINGWGRPQLPQQEFSHCRQTCCLHTPSLPYSWGKWPEIYITAVTCVPQLLDMFSQLTADECGVSARRVHELHKFLRRHMPWWRYSEISCF